jgi:hypothetical protein
VSSREWFDDKHGAELEVNMANADLDHIDAVLAMMIIAERDRQPFTPVEQVTVDAIITCAQQDGVMAIVAARELMARFAKERAAS